MLRAEGVFIKLKPNVNYWEKKLFCMIIWEPDELCHYINLIFWLGIGTWVSVLVTQGNDIKCNWITEHFDMSDRNLELSQITVHCINFLWRWIQFLIDPVSFDDWVFLPNIYSSAQVGPIKFLSFLVMHGGSSFQCKFFSFDSYFS